ncbi:hypothetical protein BGZ95_007764, partial [Linnemannia exigua]
MGVVDLDCIAANPNSTVLYGIGKAESLGGFTYVAVFRSNDNPANAIDITWNLNESVLLGKGLDDHYKYSRFGNVDCAVSSSGEFTAFFYNSIYSMTGRSKLIPMGIQTRPEGRSTYIWGNMMYGWTSEHF